MSDSDRGPRFSLRYELQPSDLAEFYRWIASDGVGAPASWSASRR